MRSFRKEVGSNLNLRPASGQCLLLLLCDPRGFFRSLSQEPQAQSVGSIADASQQREKPPASTMCSDPAKQTRLILSRFSCSLICEAAKTTIAFASVKPKSNLLAYFTGVSNNFACCYVLFLGGSFPTSSRTFRVWRRSLRRAGASEHSR